MKSKLIFLFCLFLSLFSSNLFSTEFSEAEEQYIAEILEKRMTLRTYDNSDQCIQAAKSFIKENDENPLYKNGSQEFQLTVENLLKTALYNCLYEKDMKDPALKTLMTAQYEKILDYDEKNPAENRNRWYNVSSSDIINSTMQFLPQNQAIRLGLAEKDLYDSMMKIYPDFSYLFINSGLWYMFAPAIGGGSDVKAMDFFQKAIDTAKYSYEKYYASIYYSQLLFEKNKKSESKELLSKAEEVLPGKRYIKLINLLNDNGYSVFYYTNNREKVDKKLGL